MGAHANLLRDLLDALQYERANLDPLPPGPLGAKYVAAMGGTAAVKEKAREAFERGE